MSPLGNGTGPAGQGSGTGRGLGRDGGGRQPGGFGLGPAGDCVCPKCGKKHVMNFRWIGRGVPRKFCQLCKDSS